MKYIEELISYDNSIDAIQISEILWLSQFMGSSSEPIETSTPPLDNSKPLDGVDNDRDNNIEDEIDTKEEKQEEQDYSTPNTPQKERGDYGFDKKDDIRSVFSTNVTKKEKLPAIDRQFSSLKVKQKTISSVILDDSKTADYIATTGYFHPIFKEEKSKKSYFNLHIIIDQSESIFLWEKYVEHFIKSVKFSTNFKSIKIFNLESNQDNVTVSYANSNHKIKTNSALFRDAQSITLVFSDITGKAWKSNVMFKILEKWSKGSFVAIVSMLPKRMWKKTPLRQGINIFTKSTKFLPKNRDLKAELNIINKEDNKINIPLLTFDSNAFSYLSDVLMHKKDSWIDTRIFKNITLQEVNNKKKAITISPKERVKKFFSFALPKVRQLAIYCSVLPLNQEIIREVIRVKELGNEKDVFSEFYFGRLIDKDIVATFGEYAFYEGVAKELRQYISVQEMDILLHQVSEVMSSSFGIDTTKINLLYESVDGSEELNDNERALVELMIEVLEDKGRFYEGEIKRLREKFGSIEKEESFEIEESNLIILYKENDLDIDLAQIIAHLNKICNYLIFKVGKESFELEEEVITVPWSYQQLEEKFDSYTKNSLRAIFFTEKVYYNNYFFEPRTNEKDDNLRIVSFSGWDSLTTLSKNNGAVYFIAMLLALISERPIVEHDNTSCVYDFLAIKNDIDNNMREANICTTCLDIVLEKQSFFDGRILDDLNGILNFIGKISKNDLDVCAKGSEIESSVIIQLEKRGWEKSNIIQEYNLPDRHRADVLLHYKDKNLAVIEVKSIGNEPKAGLKQAINYGKQLNIDYVYATNGIEIYEYSLYQQKGKFIDKYPSPDELYLKCSNSLTPENILRNIPYKKKIQRHHLEATVTILENIINENKRILLSLFIGAGKQTIIFEVLNKLIESNWYKRKPKVLLLAYKPSDIRFSERVLEELDIDITMFTYQKMAKKYIQFNPNTFDIVIIYEVPRMRDKVSKTNRWKEILDYFNSSTFISFTSLYTDTMKEYFGELKYKYTLENSIADGISRPYKVLPRDLDLKENLINLVVTEVIQLEDMLWKIGKTVIVCDDDIDISILSKEFRKINKLNYISIYEHEEFIYEKLNDFRINSIKIAIINKIMIDIGLDRIDNIILLTHIKFQYKFNYLLADGARKRHKTNLRQSYFKIIDYFYEYHKDYYAEIKYKDGYKPEDLEAFKLRQQKRAQFEKEQREKEEKQREQQKKENEAQLKWNAIKNSQDIEIIKRFINDYFDTTLIKEAKTRLKEIEDFFNSLSPVERKLEELYIKKTNKSQPKSTFFLAQIRKGVFDFEKCEALKLLKQMLLSENKWKEKSNAKRVYKDKYYQRTLEIIKLIEDCEATATKLR